MFAPKTGKHLLADLLPFVCLSDRFLRFAVENSAGSLSPRTNWTRVATFQLPLPTLEKQRSLAKLLWCAEHAANSLRLAHLAARGPIESSLRALIQGISAPKVKVGDLARFTSGKGIAVSALAKNPTPECPVPVYGGNGVAGYTRTPLVETPAIAIGRVGQSCGSVFPILGPSWITDNALTTTRVAESVSIEFLALCLDAAELNKRKIGNYLPLINQKVVHGVHVPLPGYEEQRRIVESSRRAREKLEILGRHHDRAARLVKTLTDALLG